MRGVPVGTERNPTQNKNARARSERCDHLTRGPASVLIDTHQGVKGLEFDRVLIVLDDCEARGFPFPYEKLFGAKPLSDQDRKNAAEGAETGIDRTRRLLYVTCTRAKKSQALVAYSESPTRLPPRSSDRDGSPPTNSNGSEGSHSAAWQETEFRRRRLYPGTGCTEVSALLPRMNGWFRVGPLPR
jgi:UvrD-like helicase C-terminal domain